MKNRKLDQSGIRILPPTSSSGNPIKVITYSANGRDVASLYTQNRNVGIWVSDLYPDGEKLKISIKASNPTGQHNGWLHQVGLCLKDAKGKNIVRALYRKTEITTATGDSDGTGTYITVPKQQTVDVTGYLKLLQNDSEYTRNGTIFPYNMTDGRYYGSSITNGLSIGGYNFNKVYGALVGNLSGYARLSPASLKYEGRTVQYNLNSFSLPVLDNTDTYYMLEYVGKNHDKYMGGDLDADSKAYDTTFPDKWKYGNIYAEDIIDCNNPFSAFSYSGGYVYPCDAFKVSISKRYSLTDNFENGVSIDKNLPSNMVTGFTNNYWVSTDGCNFGSTITMRGYTCNPDLCKDIRTITEFSSSPVANAKGLYSCVFGSVKISPPRPDIVRSQSMVNTVTNTLDIQPALHLGGNVGSTAGDRVIGIYGYYSYDTKLAWQNNRTDVDSPTSDPNNYFGCFSTEVKPGVVYDSYNIADRVSIPLYPSLSKGGKVYIRLYPYVYEGENGRIAVESKSSVITFTINEEITPHNPVGTAVSLQEKISDAGCDYGIVIGQNGAGLDRFGVNFSGTTTYDWSNPQHIGCAFPLCDPLNPIPFSYGLLCQYSDGYSCFNALNNAVDSCNTDNQITANFNFTYRDFYTCGSEYATDWCSGTVGDHRYGCVIPKSFITYSTTFTKELTDPVGSPGMWVYSKDINSEYNWQEGLYYIYKDGQWR